MARELDPNLRRHLHAGTVIPAHPLALDSKRELDERRQRALTRYYLAAGAGGLAVAVHTTQFEIREVGLLEPVLRLAAEEAQERKNRGPLALVAGVVGPTEQAVREAELARELGYDLALVSPGGVPSYSEEQLLERARAVAEVLPVFGFYLQPAVGGRVLGYDFWRDFAEIPGVEAIKMAPFNRYRTLDVVRAVCESSRRDEIALYTGNDDNIIADLLTPYDLMVDGRPVRKWIVGGLLGQWAVWTHTAVRILERVKRARQSDDAEELRELLSLNVRLTDANAAVFDAGNDFHGVIAGVHQVLADQGLLGGTWCLDPQESLSEGQREEIDRVRTAYPELTDDAFVAEHLQEWLATAKQRA
ncbi:MAG TPA: dihydrodipicolinate synthase family protein [Trueperaceae bacterium]